MKQSHVTEEQMTYARRQVEAGTPATQVCRELGISEQTFYRGQRTYQGMGFTELRRLRQLEEENRKLQPRVADLTLDKHLLQDVIRKQLERRLRNGLWCRVCGSAAR